MAKIAMCDVCLTRHDKLTRAPSYIHVKDRKDLRIDLCRVHMFEVEKKFPNVTVEFVQYVYKMVYGTELSLEDAQAVLKRRR